MKISQYLRIIGMKHVGCWDGEEKVCLSYNYVQRDFASLESKLI